MVALVVHLHLYQPPRENPWTGLVPVEPSAAPAHDWNERITAECYRPATAARIVDDHGRVVGIVDILRHCSFDVGPTLHAWWHTHAPDVAERVVQADRAGATALAHPYHHVILPLADEPDRRTEIRWGLAAFEHRFGRRARGMWLPECAVDDATLRALAEAGVEFTVLAGSQVPGFDTRRAARWIDPRDPGQSVVLVVSDGPLSHDVSFGWAGRSSRALVERALAVAGDDPTAVVTVATDAETFGHHHRYLDRMLAYAVGVEAPARGVAVGSLEPLIAARSDLTAVPVVPSSWSCVHGVERWRSDCGCSTGGGQGWNQQWRAPLRAAFDLVRKAARDAFERRGAALFADPWDARDHYIDVVLGRVPAAAFLAEHGRGPLDHERSVEALSLLESQRHALAMYTSCAWFFADLAGIEPLQGMRSAACVIDRLRSLGERVPTDAVYAVLEAAASNDPREGNGHQIWRRHVETSRVDADRLAMHAGVCDFLGVPAPARVGAFEIEVVERDRVVVDGTPVCRGRIEVTDTRTGARQDRPYHVHRVGTVERAALIPDVISEAVEGRAARRALACFLDRAIDTHRPDHASTALDLVRLVRTIAPHADFTEEQETVYRAITAGAAGLHELGTALGLGVDALLSVR